MGVSCMAARGARPAFQQADPELEPVFEYDEELDELIEIDPDGEDDALPDEEDWSRNLLDGPNADKTGSLASDIVDLVDDDKKTRKPWVRLFKRGLELMGLTKADLDDGPFPGAATVVHPLLTEAIVQFWARALAEVFPSEGPVKGKVLGRQSEERTESAERVADHMNYQLTMEDRGYRGDTSRMLFHIGAHGGAYRKTYRNTVMDRTEGVHVKVEDFIVPYTATSLESAPRFTHRLWKTPNELKKAQRDGLWVECDLSAPTEEEEDEAEEATAEVERKEKSGVSDVDARHEIYECYIDRHLPDLDPHHDPDGIELPYIVTVERQSTKLLSIRRNWHQDDPIREKRIYFTPYEYVPGFGFYPLGLFHLIGTLSEAATGSLRAVLDGAATASLQGGFITKDVAGRLGTDNDSLVIEPGSYKVVDATSAELKDGIYTPDFKPPAPVLFQLLGLLIESGRTMASVPETMVGEGDNRGPVGTTVALIEQGMKVFSTVHQGLHASAGHEFRIRYEINKEYAPADGYVYDVHGDEKEVYREDYGPHTDIVPVSDPNIFSTAQRLAIAQAVYQLSMDNPDIYDKLEVHRRLLEAMKTPDYEGLLIDPDKMMPLDPVAENQCLLTQKPISVFPEQDHQSHITVHLAFLQNPGFGGHPEVYPLIEAQAKAHIAQHLAALHAQQLVAMGVPSGVIDFNAQRPEEIMPGGEMLAVGAMAAQVADQIAQAPGLPPPPPPPGQAEHEQRMRFDEETHQQGMKHKQEAHDLEMGLKADEAGKEQDRKDDAFVSDQARKEVEGESSLDQREKEGRQKLQQQQEQSDQKGKAKPEKGKQQ